ncbi:MAG: SIS domain-containing protein [bacterium]|nr:SIS domain-containing protein [bacterium]
MQDNYQKVLESIKKLPDQAKQAWEEVSKLDIHGQYKKAKSIVVCSMGGSGLATDLMLGVTKSSVPIILVQDNILPGWADMDTLAFLSSYSGNTHEVLSFGAEALDRENNCLIASMTTGGALKEFLNQNAPSSLKYFFDPLHNPSGQPRLGLGYNFIGQLAMFYKLGYVNTEPEDLDKQIDCLYVAPTVWKELEAETEDLATKIQGKLPVIFGSEHLAANAHVLANQLNETSKTFAVWFEIPESNHHLLEGLKQKNAEIFPIFLDSPWYRPSNRRSTQITQEIFKENGLNGYTYKAPESNNKLREVFQTIIFSSLLSVKLSKLYGEDPISIPTIDYFKSQLEKE